MTDRPDDTGRRPKIQSDDDRSLRSPGRQRSQHDTLDNSLDGEVQSEVLEEITDVHKILITAGVQNDPRLAKVVRAVIEHVTNAELRSANRDLEVATVRGDGPQVAAMLGSIAEQLGNLEHWQAETIRWRLGLEGVDQRNGRLGRLTDDFVALKKQVRGWRRAAIAAITIAAASLGGIAWNIWGAGQEVGAYRTRIERLERDVDNLYRKGPTS